MMKRYRKARAAQSVMEVMNRFINQIKGLVGFRSDTLATEGGSDVKILKKGPAMRIIFFYPGEEGTYVENAYVTLFENGIVHIKSNQEETTTHLQNCEILWNFEIDSEDRANKVRLLKPKAESRTLALDDERDPGAVVKTPGIPEVPEIQ